MGDVSNILGRNIFPVLAPQVAAVLRETPDTLLNYVTEIRLRAELPLLLVLGNTDIMLNSGGQAVDSLQEAYLCSREDLAKTLQLISKNSMYAFEQELKLGFITINGGHRVGLAGQAIVENGRIKTLKNINSLNIRLAREVKSCADQIIPYIITGGGQVLNTLLISPPRCGKTTMLRDIIRQISNGGSAGKFKGVQVGVVDERSEIAACQNGIPTVDLGLRVDVLDGCPKADGLLMLIRSMAPQVVVTDELGREEDVRAVREAVNAGVSVIASVHGRDVEEVLHRPFVGELIQHRYFDRYIVLCNKPRVGTVAEIISVKNNEIIWNAAKGVKICG